MSFLLFHLTRSLTLVFFSTNTTFRFCWFPPLFLYLPVADFCSYLYFLLFQFGLICSLSTSLRQEFKIICTIVWIFMLLPFICWSSNPKVLLSVGGASRRWLDSGVEISSMILVSFIKDGLGTTLSLPSCRNTVRRSHLCAMLVLDFPGFRTERWISALYNPVYDNLL